MKIVVIGGGAGGSSFAARMRRLDNQAEITILEKTNETSIASCGLPYFIGDVISERSAMQVASPAFLKQLFDIDVRLNTGVAQINPNEKTVITENAEVIPYDKLVLALGAKPFVPHVEGMDLLPCFSVKMLQDADKIKAFISEKKPQKAVVIGGGFIGVEVAENLRHLGLQTALIEQAGQVLMPLDGDMVAQIHTKMRQNGIRLYLNNGVQKISQEGVVLMSGQVVPADMVIWAIGVRPETQIAGEAGIQVNERGFILTNEYMHYHAV